MSKLEKIDRELEKAREKAAEWQAKIKDLEKQRQEEENSMIVQAVRSLKLTPAELAAFFSNPAITASGQVGPKPEKEKEDTVLSDLQAQEGGSRSSSSKGVRVWYQGKKVKNMKSAIAVQIMKSRSQNDLILMKRRSCALHKLNMKEASVYLSRRNRQSLRRKRITM